MSHENHRYLRTGLSFGLASGAITTLGLIVGLSSGTNNRNVVLAGILTIAIADALSDAVGIHLSVESNQDSTPQQIWISTISTFLSKFIFALSFVVPFVFLILQDALWVSIIWGFTLVIAISVYLARANNEPIWKPVCEHVLITALVVILTNYVGEYIAYLLY